MRMPKPLSGLAEGRDAQVQEVCVYGGIRRRLQDLGFIPGARVACIQRSPLGDPTAYSIRGAVVALRAQDASKIIVTEI